MKITGLKKILLVFCSAAALLGMTGCGFETYLKTSKRPEDTVKAFFECVKDCQFDKCADYMAENASFDINNQTGYEFVERVMQFRFERLTYEIVQNPVQDSTSAYCVIRVTAPDISSVQDTMTTEYPKSCSQYIKDHSLKSFPSDNNEIVNEVAWQTFEGLANNITDETIELTINFVYESDEWKIKSDRALCEAVFGRNIMGGN